MEGGFTFDGVDIADIGLEYAPDNQNTYVYHQSQFSLHEQSFDAHDGGYFYGATLKPKDFKLRCFYYDTHVLSGLMTRINNVFRRGRTGRLVFKQRPWCWYVATVVQVDAAQMQNYRNGVVVITMRAYYPFARTDFTQIGEDDPNREDLLANQAMLEGSGWDLGKNFVANPNSPLTQSQQILLYNPGTEYCDVAIEIAGNVGAGVTIRNNTTGQVCRIVGLNTASTNNYLICDSMSGKVMLTNGNISEYAYKYHDKGFIRLESSYGIDRDLQFYKKTGDTNHIYSRSKLIDKLVGKRVVIDTTQADGFLDIGRLDSFMLNDDTPGGVVITKILSQEYVDQNDEWKIEIEDDIQDSEITQGIATIAMLNDIEVIPDDSMSLTKLIFRYRPTFN